MPSGSLTTRRPPLEWAVGIFDGTADKPAIVADALGKITMTNVPKLFVPTFVARLGYNHGGYYSSSLIVGRIVGGKLVYEGDEIPLSNDNSAADPEDGETYSCQAAWKVLDGEPPKKVAIDYQGDCEAPGRHVYQWRDGKLVEVGALP